MGCVRAGARAALRGLAAVLALAAGGAVRGSAAEALAGPTPLTTPAPGTTAGEAADLLASARRAQELGLPTVAISLYEQLMTQPGADRAALTLPLATALLDAGRAADAERVLSASPGPRSPEWRLRMGLAAAQQKKLDVASDQANHINVDQLTRPDRAWFWFLQAVIADTSTPRDVPRANYFYDQAQKEAPSEMALAHFLAAGERVRLTEVAYKPEEIALYRQQYQQWEQRGSQEAYHYAELYAVALSASGQRSEAVRFLSELLVRIPRAERQYTDDFRRLLGLIGDRGRGGAGRNALNQLLETGGTPEFQRQALQLLAQDSEREPERGLFRAELDKLLAATPKSAIYDSLLLMRAQLALGDSPKDYATAERRANELKDNYPGSPLHPQALMVLATSAWEQQRYRLAADNARLAREALETTPAAKAPTEARVVAQTAGELRVLEAEARFRAQDYRLAAEAYAAALRDPPAGVHAGDLMFQRALASIRADEHDPNADLTKVVDELEADPRFDAANRWEAEWSLARGLKVQGRTEAALKRVTALLDSPAGQEAAITPELRARMTWLQVRLSFDANQPELTLQLAPKLDGVVDGIAPELRSEIASMGALLEAEAEFKLDREAAALKRLDNLRAQFPKSDAAIYSYLVTADYYAEPGRDKIQDAQNWLQQLVDNPNYKESPYVPYALFKSALLSERLGQEKDLRDANRRIEDLVDSRRNPPAPAELVFAARLNQGDLLRTLNQFPQAQRAYEDLVNNPKYADRPDVVIAQLRLAECLNAQSSTDPSGSNADQAQSIFEELLYRVSAPADVRVEAGYNLGKLLERRGQFEKARDVWFTDVIKKFLLDAKAGEATRATVPYWLARTLVALGELLQQRENIDEARRVYVLLRDSNLGYEDVANERLQQLGMPPVAPTKS
jgi:TolA-binding protein